MRGRSARELPTPFSRKSKTFAGIDSDRCHNCGVSSAGPLQFLSPVSLPRDTFVATGCVPELVRSKGNGYTLTRIPVEKGSS